MYTPVNRETELTLSNKLLYVDSKSSKMNLRILLLRASNFSVFCALQKCHTDDNNESAVG